MMRSHPVPSGATTAPIEATTDGQPSPELIEALRAGAAAADRTAGLVPAHDQMIDEGLFHLLVPTELGGAGASPTDWFDAAHRIATVDASAGWLMAQGAAQTAWIAVAGSDELVAEFFATRQVLASTSAAVVANEPREQLARVLHGTYAGPPGFI